jgi:hypothetical protein
VPNLESIAIDRTSGRELFLLDGDDPTIWDATSDHSLGPFTVLLAIDADRYSDEIITDLAQRLLERGQAYLCAWGPGCARIHTLFDLEYVGDGSKDWGRFLMTTDHADESLAEALWFAIDLAIPEDAKEAAESAVVIGVDSPDWRTEILARIADLDELRGHVVEDAQP